MVNYFNTRQVKSDDSVLPSWCKNLPETNYYHKRLISEDKCKEAMSRDVDYILNFESLKNTPAGKSYNYQMKIDKFYIEAGQNWGNEVKRLIKIEQLDDEATTANATEENKAADGNESINENQELDFYSPYGCSKGSADQYLKDYA